IILAFILIWQIQLYSQIDNNDDNSILLFGKVLKFDISKSEILNDFTEFKKYDKNDMAFFGLDLDGENEVYSYVKSSNPKIKEFDPFDSVFAIFLKFKESSLKEIEMVSGHTQEGYGIVESLTDQFSFNRKEIDKDLEYEILYYKKNNLEAIKYYYETAVIRIKYIK
ncbi:MAG: hypothetical protein K8I03_01230, partial [Ignavibacteria bacterium]|nr:hypothetical protein [Ignavibacteria bacterium]